MKTLLIFLQIYLLMCGVFDADADEVKSVSVMEGDSVTLNPDLTQIQGIIEILWRFGEKLSTIAQIDGNDISYEDIKRFKGRLQLNQTGSLTITNTRTNHSGLYEAEISHKTGTSNQKFSLTVYESPPGIAGAEAEMKLMSVKEGDPVTLDVPQIQGDELIVWRFGDGEKLIVKADLETKSSPLYYEEERFRDRLKLNDQTGSLTIINTRTTDSGPYTAKISSNKQILYKRFIVTVIPGLSGGAVAGIVVGVLLLAAAAAGVMYYLRPRITNLPNQTWSVLEGDYVTLDPEAEIQRGDEIQWLFGDRDGLIAEIKGENREKTDKGPDGRFKNRLELDKTTGSLTIEYIRTAHAGRYTLKIRRGRETFYKRFIVSVSEREITVLEGESVTLEPVYEIKKDDLIRWLFGDREQQTVIAEIKGETGEICKYADERFRDRLQLDETTGSLTITNTRTEHSGVYRLQIISSSGVSEQTFTVTVRDNVEQVFLEEDSVTLKPDTKIQRDDQILWMFGYQDDLIAQIKGGTVDKYDGVNKRFRGRLKLDKMTGSLTIKKIETKHTGPYKLQIISSSGGILVKKFKVSIRLRNKTVTAGEPVRLHTALPKIQKDYEIQWLFGNKNSLIAEIKGVVRTHVVPDKRFRDRLELDEKTGDLTIKNCTDEHTGRYKLKIRSSERNTYWTYIVIIRGAAVTNEAREILLLKENNDSRRNRVNESATVVMPLLNGDDLDVVNEEERTSLL